MRLTSITLAAAALVDTTNAWWGTGHLLVARIANDLLMNQSPSQLIATESLLGVLKRNDPSSTQKEGDHPFVECTTFADDIKGKGGSYQAGWHFIDQPFLDEGGKISDYNFTADSHNVTEAIDNIVSWVNHKSGYKDTYTYKMIMANGREGHDEEEGLSTAMRFLIHYTGDVHQPLHGTARVDHEYPTGDRGGNSFPLPTKQEAKNLHAVWDSVLYEFSDDSTLVSLSFFINTPFSLLTPKVGKPSARELHPSLKSTH
jgi:hypothetical protein